MSSPRTVVVVGAGLAAHNVAEHLRRRGFDGRVVVLGDEDIEPYDRPPLSKDQLWGEEDPTPRLLARPDAYDKADIEVRTGVRARALDTVRKVVTTDRGEEVAYDSLVIATGSRARTLADSYDHTGVLSLRSFDDVLHLRKAIAEKPRMVVVGAGLIGCEVAGHASSIGLDVTVVDPMPTPMHRVVGPTIGAKLGEMHTAAGSTMRHGVGVEGVLGDDHAEAVRLTDGTTLPADLVLVAFGATPNVEWLDGSGLEIGRGVVTDELCRTSAPDVYAIGDVAQALQPALGTHMVIEHWNNAREQGAAVAATILGEEPPRTALPYFWTDQLGTKIQALGWVEPDAQIRSLEWEEPKPGAVHLFGSPEGLTAAVSFNAAGRLMKLRGLIEDTRPWAEAEAIVRK